MTGFPDWKSVSWTVCRIAHDYYITTWCDGLAVVGRINDRLQASLIHLYLYRCSADLLGGQAPLAVGPIGTARTVILATAPPHNQYFIGLAHAHTLISRRDVIRYEHKLSSLSNYL